MHTYTIIVVYKHMHNVIVNYNNNNNNNNRICIAPLTYYTLQRRLNAICAAAKETAALFFAKQVSDKYTKI